jgi:hypothetical protein
VASFSIINKCLWISPGAYPRIKHLKGFITLRPANINWSNVKVQM